MKLVLAVALGGAIGAVARHRTVELFARRFGPDFPWGVLFVNVAGSFLMGLAVEWLMLKLGPAPVWRAFLAAGVLGAFTTFSSFALDVAGLHQRGQLWAAAIYVAASVALSILALFAGLWAARSLAG